jgi:cation:H+ antiporter
LCGNAGVSNLIFGGFCLQSCLTCAALKWVTTWIESTGAFAPWLFMCIFLAGSFLMIWRLEAMNKSGIEGTVLGTLVMPYCSGMGNLVFAFIMGSKGAAGSEVVTNALVNNVTNMTLLLGLPAIFWGMSVLPANKGKKKKPDQKEHKINRLSLLLTLTAAIFFIGAVWALGRDGKVDSGDGIVLIGLFLFWQCFHVFEVLKSNVRQNKSFTWKLPVDLLLLAAGAYGIYFSTDWLVEWISAIHSGFVSVKYLGWLSGWLMVLPNGLLALYYARRGNPEVVYTSQVGDGHVSIPLSLGIFSLYETISLPRFFFTGAKILLFAAAIHFLFVALLGRLPRLMGWTLVIAYVLFLYAGLGK